MYLTPLTGKRGEGRGGEEGGIWSIGVYGKHEEPFEVFAYFLCNGHGPKISLEKSSSKAKGLAIVRPI